MKYNINNYKEVANLIENFIDLDRNLEIENGSCLMQINHTWYMLSHNGSETNVELINGKSVSIPHTSNKLTVTPLVLAYRISAYINGGWGNINWNVNENIIKTAIVEYKSNSIEVINHIAKEVM